MEIIYKAFDGKEFDDEEECLDYELKIKTENFTKNNHLAFFDKEGNRLDISIFKALNEAEFISISTEDAFEIVERIGDKSCLGYPSDCGLWQWDDDHDKWIRVDYKIEELTKILNLYHKIKSAITKREEE